MSGSTIEDFVMQRMVEFRDTDAAGIVHFSAFFPMMEAAEHAFLRHLGLSVMAPLENGQHLSWPRVAASCDYAGAARFEDVLSIQVVVESLGSKSVKYRFDIRRGQQEIATGRITAVCCIIGPDTGLRSIPIPDEIRASLSPYLRV